MIKILITLVLAFVAGYLTNEHTRADQITSVLHQVESQTAPVQPDLVAHAGHLARHQRRDAQMFHMFDRVIRLIEHDMNHR